MPQVAYKNRVTQKQALQELARLVAQGMSDPLVVETARRIVSDCPARDDRCEVEAIYEAVKNGHPDVRGLERGLRYVSDPRSRDWFTGARRLLQMCARGACAEDCDGHAVLVAALLGAIGFQVGLEAWGHECDEYEHVYAVVGIPKHRPPAHGKQFTGLDTTEDRHVGWKPPRGCYMVAILEDDEEDDR